MSVENPSIEEIKSRLERSFSERKLLCIKERKKALKALKKAVLDNEPRIFAALKSDLGKSKFESYLAEIAFIKEELNLALKNLHAWSNRRPVSTPLAFMPAKSYIEPMPKGVVLILSPWNYPFQLSLVPLVSAIAAGNCVVLKPSELTPSSSNVIHDFVHDYLDNDCFKVINGGVECAKELLEHSWDHIFYTGSTNIGKEVMAKAAKHLTPVTLELGGKSPCIIDQSCNLNLSVKRILWGKTLNAGQTCIAPDYLLIDKKIKKSFIEKFKLYAKEMFGEDISKSQSFARIINERHCQRLVSYLKDGEIIFGGKHNVHEKFIEPTLLDHVDLSSPAMNEEIFGPILPMIEFETIDQPIKIINAKPNPLALYLFSNNKQIIDTVSQKTLSGGMCINDCISHVAIPELPFGGVRHSGIGSYHGEFGFETFSHMRSVHQRSNMLDNPIKYAPYSDSKLNIVRVVL